MFEQQVLECGLLEGVRSPAAIYEHVAVVICRHRHYHKRGVAVLVNQRAVILDFAVQTLIFERDAAKMDLSLYIFGTVGINLSFVFAEYCAGIFKVLILAEIEAVAAHSGLEI